MKGSARYPLIVFVLVIITQAIGSYLEGDSGGPVSRRPPIELAPDGGPELAPPGRLDPVADIEVGPKRNSVGTAFAIRDDGVWLTARHVVDGCDKVGIIIGERRAVAADRVEINPRADMAILWTRRKSPAMAIASAPLRVNQAGYHFGFPGSRPGQATSKLIGRLRARSIGRYRITEPAIAWAETARAPDFDRLGGISGGPAVNSRGEIIGVTFAGSKRRGRIFTTAPQSMEQLLKAANIQPNGRQSADLDVSGPTMENFVKYGDALRRQLTVAQVICRVIE